VATDGNGVISVTADKTGDATIDGSVLTLIPTDATGNALVYAAGTPTQVGGWKCGGAGTTIPPKFLPGSCRG
jgi:type IV pilus assembly protein PilA